MEGGESGGNPARRSASRSSRRSEPGSTAQQLHSAAIRLLRALRTTDAASGLPAPQLSALSVLVFDGPRTLGELAASEGVKPPSMTRTVQGLEAAGMVRRTQDPEDRRVAILQATARGERALTSGRERRLQQLASLMADLPARDVATLRDAAAIIGQMVDNEHAADQ